MYRSDWIEQLKLRLARPPQGRDVGRIGPAVWALGATSMLTDISAEMVHSVLPAYLVLHLRLSPLQFGIVDGIYNGFAMALLGLAAGLWADRGRRHKEIAAAGYGISALCKLLLLAAGSSWGWLMAVIALDRGGKAIRTAPRDTMLSLNAPAGLMATAFAVHRALDAGGMMLGPLIAFVLLWQFQDAYDVVWIGSFVIAIVGLSVLLLYVPNPRRELVATAPGTRPPGLRAMLDLRGIRSLAALAGLLACATVSDGFLFLMLQQRAGVPAGYFPLFYVALAAIYMVFSIPAGRLADRLGRRVVFVLGYGLLGVVYAVVLGFDSGGIGLAGLVIVLLGMYYAGTEGILMAMTSTRVPSDRRATGLAAVATALAAGKLLSSILFGWLWQTQGQQTAVQVFCVLLAVSLAVGYRVLRRLDGAHPS